MNRIEICFSKEVQQHADEAFRPKDSVSAWRTTTEFSTFVPLHYEPRYAYPLIVWLHGSGDDERQLQRVMPKISIRNYAAVGPRGGSVIGNGVESGYSWEQAPHQIERARQSVMECITAAQTRFNIGADRIFLAGFGAGGTMALRIAMSMPEMFSGVASLAGGFPNGHRPLLRIEAARALPVFLAHGRKGVCYDEDRVCQDLRLLHAAGISVTLRQYLCSDELTNGNAERSRCLADGPGDRLVGCWQECFPHSGKRQQLARISVPLARSVDARRRYRLQRRSVDLISGVIVFLIVLRQSIAAPTVHWASSRIRRSHSV